jgi:hypothetical protein
MIKRWLGIDGIDFLIQAAITICVGVVLTSTAPNDSRVEELMVGTTFAASFGVLAFRRHLARKRGELGPKVVQTGGYDNELEQRVADLEAAQQRLYELEERVDFAERLLAQHRPPDRIAEPR